MKIPGFTAEASLYNMSGHHQVGRRAINSPRRQIINAVQPALQREERIEVFDCGPGFIGIGEGANLECFPNPLTEPSRPREPREPREHREPREPREPRETRGGGSFQERPRVPPNYAGPILSYPDRCCCYVDFPHDKREKCYAAKCDPPRTVRECTCQKASDGTTIVGWHCSKPVQPRQPRQPTQPREPRQPRVATL